MNFDEGAKYIGYTLGQLRQFEWEGKANDAMRSEIERRLKVRDGDLTAMTPGERLKRASFCKTAFEHFRL